MLKKQRIYLLIAIYLVLSTVNYALNVESNPAIMNAIADAEQLELISEHKEFVFVVVILGQLVIGMSLVLIEAIGLCVLKSRISNYKIRFETAVSSVLVGNIVVSIYHLLAIYLFHIQTMEQLKILNLLPFGVAIKTIVIFVVLHKAIEDSHKKYSYKEGLIFLSIEYICTLIGYFSV